jgi:hypothetical protein
VGGREERRSAGDVKIDHKVHIWNIQTPAFYKLLKMKGGKKKKNTHKKNGGKKEKCNRTREIQERYKRDKKDKREINERLRRIKGD